MMAGDREVAASSESGSSEGRWTREAWRAFSWTFAGVLTGGLGLECVIKIYEIWADGLDETQAGRWTLTLVLAFVGAGLLSAFYFVFRKAIRQVRLVMTGSHVEITPAKIDRQYPALITALSTCSDQHLVVNVANNLKGLRGKERLEAFCADDALSGVSWQQTVRGIDVQVRWDKEPVGFPEVRLLLSEGDEGSEKEWRQGFKKLLETLYNDAVTIDQHVKPVAPAIDFEKYNTVARAIEAQLADLEETHGVGEVMIDATGGQKPLSIAVAIVSLRSPRQRFQYVRNNGEVRYYNASATGQELPSTGG